MKKIQVFQLSKEKFDKYGYYSNLTSNAQVKLGEGVVQFYRDIITMNFKGEEAAFSVTNVKKRNNIIDFLECHNNTYEAMLPLDEDVIICFAPATRLDDIPWNKIEAFKVPKNTLIVIKKGVWHCAPFSIMEEANVLVVLPERTYENDCFFIVQNEENKKIKINTDKGGEENV